MPVSQLMQLAKSGDLNAFEAKCLEALGGGQVRLAELVGPFRQFERSTQGARVGTLGQMVLENGDAKADPIAALAIARVAAVADAANAEMRVRVASLYREVHGDTPGFAMLLEASGLESGRPIRNAVRLMEVCLTVEKGDPLGSRTEDTVAEVIEVDRENGIFTIRREGRLKTVTAAELAREFDRIDADDFRVLRHLKPARLEEMVRSDPVQVVTNILRSHGNEMDGDTLKQELTPRFVSEADWAKWWTGVRALLKKSPNVVVEGRSPVILKYTAQALTLEDETWATFTAQSEPEKWLSTVEGYLREKKKDKQPHDHELLQKCHAHLMKYIKSIEHKRPAEALACALVTERLDEECGIKGDEAKALAVEMLKRAPDPAPLIARLEDNSLWDLALSAMEAARPSDKAVRAAALIRQAPAGLLDRLSAMAREGNELATVQAHIDTALAAPVEHPEMIYWLWKGPNKTEGLTLPASGELFRRILSTLSALGRTLMAPAETTKRFRHRMRAALQIRDFAQVKDCLANLEPGRAITLKTQIQHIDGLGDNTPARILDLLRDTYPELWRVVEKRREAWEDESVVWGTRSGIARKTEERDHLVNVTMRENAKRIGEAAALGDLSENSEYKFALEERDLLRARLAQMNNDLSQSQPIEPDDVPVDRVGIGSKVVLRDIDRNEKREMSFLGPFDADVDRGIFNYRAPMSLKVMGLRVGEQVKLQLDDRDINFEVVSIGNALA